MTRKTVAWLGKQLHDLETSYLAGKAVACMKKWLDSYKISHMTGKAVAWLGKQLHDWETSCMTRKTVT